MNRWRVGEDRGSKETDRCPLTHTIILSSITVIASSLVTGVVPLDSKSMS
jgi:hypothetical protein